MAIKLFFLTITIYTLASCSYKLFADKRYVVQRERGYLVFNGDYGVSFYPTRDTIDEKFLSDKKKKVGYKVEFTTDWLDSISTDYSSIPVIKGEKLSIIPVEIEYFLGDSWQKKDELSQISYRWNNEMFVLKFKPHDWRRILTISVVRKTDIRRLRELKTEDFPLHYR